MSKLLNRIKENFSNQTILVVGDLVADQFLFGTIDRISREAPVFIIRHDETETLAGGSANATVNVASLGAKVVLLCMIGGDEIGTDLLNVLDSNKVDCHLIVV